MQDFAKNDVMFNLVGTLMCAELFIFQMSLV